MNGKDGQLTQCPAIALGFCQHSLFNVRCHREEDKPAGGEKVIFTRLINDSNVIILLGVRVRNHGVNGAPLESHFVISIVYTDGY